eukprot:TRINITY_DN6828_c0_g1_i1.p1 TRINITY_DN6828_c0_g1~~TRINITY_DN6828_c0_g1_i1.p1  ORF type:complete len:131 (+),score=23.66 TRINITY_DN6828_c0_g1_i1:67-459(+)
MCIRDSNFDHWYDQSEVIAQLILNTLVKICITEYNQLKERHNDISMVLLIKVLLCILAEFAEDNKFQSFFIDNKETLIVGVILVLMKSTDYEKELFYDNPLMFTEIALSLIHICRCRRYAVCRSRWSPYH